MAGWFSTLFRPRTVLDQMQRQTAMHILGEPGSGKTSLMETYIWQDIEAGRGVGVVDNAGDLSERLAIRLAARPDLWHRLVWIDMSKPEWMIRINPLAAFAGMDSTRVSEFVKSMVIRLWGVDTDQTPRMTWVMTNAFQALAALNLTLVDLPQFLLNKPFRDQMLPKLPASLAPVRFYFDYEFPKTQGGARLFSLPILNRLGPLLFDADIRAMLAGSNPLDFRKVLDEGYIVIAKVPKGILGQEASSLLAAFIVARFQQAAISRANTDIGADNGRPDYYLYLDEFHNYTTDNITEILDESRKFNLRLTMAHQYLEQISPRLRSAVLNTSGTMISMRVGYEDAKVLAPIVFPRPDWLAQTNIDYRVIGSSRIRLIQTEERVEANRWDNLAQALVNQENRSFWVRRKGLNNPRQLHTHDLPVLQMSTEVKERLAQMRETAGPLFGVRRTDALAELAALEQQRQAMQATVKPKKKRGRPAKAKEGATTKAK